jgi:hypothetical protein
MYARSVYDYKQHHTVIVSRWTGSDSSSLLTFQISRSDIPVRLNLRFCSKSATCDLGHTLSFAMSDFSSTNEGLITIISTTKTTITKKKQQYLKNMR